MNLADAIRKAATSAKPSGADWSEIQSMIPGVSATSTDSDSSNCEPGDVRLSVEPGDRMPDPPAQLHPSGNIVRLELFLGPEQLGGLFRWLQASQHSVMTLREAASFLRMSPGVLEQMALDGEVPSFEVDGKWRFSRASLDEWVGERSNQRRAG